MTCRLAHHDRCRVPQKFIRFSLASSCDANCKADYINNCIEKRESEEGKGNQLLMEDSSFEQQTKEKATFMMFFFFESFMMFCFKTLLHPSLFLKVPNILELSI
jgi:hypothetical protein